MPDITDNPLKIEGFNSCGLGKIEVKQFRMMAGNRAFEITFKREGFIHKFCIDDYNAKYLAAFITLYS
jgi:hypothetical protein